MSARFLPFLSIDRPCRFHVASVVDSSGRKRKACSPLLLPRFIAQRRGPILPIPGSCKMEKAWSLVKGDDPTDGQDYFNLRIDPS